MGQKPLGFFRIPPNYAALSEEEQLAVADAIGEKLRAALLAQDAGGDDVADEEERHERDGTGNDRT